MTINLPIQENENVRIVGIDPNSRTLTICDFQTSPSPHIISASHIYDTLESCDKNLCDGKKIIEKEETDDEVIYHFNYGLSITSVSGCTSGIYCFSFGVLGCKESAKKDFEYTKQYRWDGRDYKSVFHGPVYLTCSFLERVHFAHCEFHKILSTQANPELSGRVEIHNGISFDDCKFFDEVRLVGIVSGALFERDKYFKNAQSSSFGNCYFEKKCDLSRSTFCNQIRFDGAEFSEDSDFQECVFQCHASFYKCIFKKPANFSQVNFKEGVNFVNSKMDFTFYEFREFVEQLVREKYPLQKISPKSHKEKVIDFIKTILSSCLQIIKNKNESDLKSKEKKEKNKYQEKVAKDFQDSFRLLKHIANRDGNTLLASHYHKFELYAHEIALIGVEARGIKAKTYEEGFRNLELIGKTIDRWQLAFYRHLSDHHTSLLKVFNNLLIVVSACFLMNVYYLNLFKVYETTNIVDAIESFLKQNQTSAYFVVGIFIVLALVFFTVVIVQLILMLLSVKKIREYKEELLLIATFFTREILENLKLFSKYIAYIAPVLVLIMLGYFILEEYFSQIPRNNALGAAIPLLLSSIFIVLIYVRSVLLRGILVFFSYVVILCLVLPNIGNHYVGIVDFLKDTQADDKAAFKVIVLFYVFLQSIILWSLQKTARKNSIIPS